VLAKFGGGIDAAVEQLGVELVEELVLGFFVAEAGVGDATPGEHGTKRPPQSDDSQAGIGNHPNEFKKFFHSGWWVFGVDVLVTIAMIAADIANCKMQIENLQSSFCNLQYPPSPPIRRRVQSQRGSGR
jgi:hypothetical protein